MAPLFLQWAKSSKVLGGGGFSNEGDNEHASMSLRSDISQQQADSGVVKEGCGARAWPDQGCPQFLDPWTNSIIGDHPISSNMDPHLTYESQHKRQRPIPDPGH